MNHQDSKTPIALPWMLREFERAARRPGIYWARCLAATNLIFLVFFFSSLPRGSRFWSFWMSLLFLGNVVGTFMIAVWILFRRLENRLRDSRDE